MTNWKEEFLNLLINYTSRFLFHLKNVIKIPIMAISNQDIKKWLAGTNHEIFPD